jgi:succinyl-diaminopimelate desuccinylase
MRARDVPPRSEAAVLAAIGRRADELIDLLGDLVRAPSVNPPGDTRQAAEVARAYLARVGFQPHVVGAAPERPSVLAVLAALADAAVPLRGTVAVALVADEETGGAGARDLLERGLLPAEAVVVGETTDNQVAIAEKGVAWLRLTVRGRTAHASVPLAGVNAASHLVRWLTRLEERVAPRLAMRRHPLVSPPSLTLTRLEGGVAPNVVPDRAAAVVDRRVLPDEPLDAVRAELLAEWEALAPRAPAARAEVETVVWAEPFETPADAAVVRAALAARARLGLSAAPVGYQQASDGRFFGARGVPTLVLGPGVPEGTHVPDESVPLAQVLEAARLHALTACYLLG